ncbi:transporter substrate-binding domain-containing protein [Colwellia psychrerythraea]|uniref:Diguanylate cyclase with extracellular solute binding sensor n=1 Tax=Colwellia psychrerythraea TaxID=28229 RepID=A0A099KGH6_COLPS|nr:transporter substrate-binding domain-containing protein [Colwellia psychrerythraea]KGJ89894.1 diguanylate cyclase with extracellular solute binding sensor [Colwellia psychrerythraea]
MKKLYQPIYFIVLTTILLSFYSSDSLSASTVTEQVKPASGDKGTALDNQPTALSTSDFKQPLTIAINETSFPYHSIDEQGSAIGLMADMWRLWAEKQQVEIQFVVLPWLDTLSQVAKGNVDMHGGLTIIDSRRKKLEFSKPLFHVYTHLYVHQQLNTVDSLADLKPYSIGVVEGSAHIDKLKKYHPELALKTYGNRHNLYRAALNNEILVFSGLEKLADNFPEYESLRQRFPVHKVLRYQQGDYGVAVAKHNDALLRFIEQGFEKVSRHERSAIERKWLGLDKNKDSLLVAFSSHYPPYMGVSPSGEPQGLLIDVWRLWSQHVGINVEFVARDMAEGLDLIAEQKADVLMAYPDHVQAPLNTLFAQPIYLSNAQIYLSKKIKNIDGERLYSLEQFSQLFSQDVIGIWQGSTFKDKFLAQYPKINVRYFSSLNAMLTAAEQGEISGLVGLVDLINARLVQSNLQALFYRLNSPVITLNLSPVIHQKNNKLTEIIDKGFSELDINTLIQIEDRWLNGNTGEYYYKNQAKKIKLNDDEITFLASRGKINLGFIKQLSPVEFIDENGDFSGINRDIINLIKDRTNIEFNYAVFDSWQLLYQALLDDEIDMLGSITPTPGREGFMLFTESYWQMPWVMVHPQYYGRKTKLEDFYGKQVAIVKGYYLIAELRKKHPLITFKLVDDREQALVALQQERVDGFITTMASATQLLKQENIVTLIISMMEGVSLDKSHFGINKQLPLLKDIINKGLASITEKEKQVIYDTWFTLAIKTGLDKNVVLQVGAQIGVIILLVLGVIVMWNRRLQVEIKHREQLEKIMKHMATHDELTGLANRVLLKDRLSTAIEFHQRQSLKMAVLFIDLDGFKNINDTHGHDVGDELLQQVALRLQGCVRSSDTVVRFGGDEFVLLLTGLHSPNEAAYVAEKVLRLMQKEFELSKGKSKINAFIGCSIGIAMYPNDGDNDTELLKIADTMMYKVKAAGKNHYIFN